MKRFRTCWETHLQGGGKKMRDKCELFSKVCGGEVPCAHPEKEKCGFQFYNMQGVNMGLCRYRIEEIGFKKVWEEMVVLVRWKKEKK